MKSFVFVGSREANKHFLDFKVFSFNLGHHFPSRGKLCFFTVKYMNVSAEPITKPKHDLCVLGVDQPKALFGRNLVQNMVLFPLTCSCQDRLSILMQHDTKHLVPLYLHGGACLSLPCRLDHPLHREDTGEERKGESRQTERQTEREV